MTTPERPHNLEAERSVLGSIILDVDAYYTVASIIDTDDFYLVRHRWIFDAIRHLHREREPVDYLTVCNEVSRRGKLAKIGGEAFVIDLVQSVPSSYNAEGYAEIVREEAHRRRLLAAASEIAKVAHATGFDLDDRRVEARKAFDSAEKTKIRPDAMSAEEAVHILFQEVGEWAENPLKPGEVRGISTGLADLDAMLDGIEPGLYLVAAVQHTGKTAFCQQLAVNAAKAGRPVLFFSMEHSAEYMYHRIASSICKLDIRQIRHGLNGAELKRYHDALSVIEDMPIEIIGKQLTMSQIEAEIRARVHRGLAFVVIDNIEQAGASVSGSKQYIQYQRAAYWMLGIATDDDVQLPIFTTMQLGTKSVSHRQDKKPEMGDLYGADGPNQAASVVLLLHRDDRWTFEESEMNHLIEVSCWKDKINHTGTGKARKFVFGSQGQVWDRTREDVRL
jgi:replicative DNA helicase